MSRTASDRNASWPAAIQCPLAYRHISASKAGIGAMSKALGRILLLSSLMLPLSIHAQQPYVGRFDIYNGFTWFDSPSVHLEERGYHLQAGLNLRTWLAMGFDYSVVSGNLVLRPNDLKHSLQTEIGAEL